MRRSRQPNYISRNFSDIASDPDHGTVLDRQARKTLMTECVDIFLRVSVPGADAGAKEDDNVDNRLDRKINGEIGVVSESEAHVIREKLRVVVWESLYASIPWVASCLALEVRINPLFPLSTFLPSSLGSSNPCVILF